MGGQMALQIEPIEYEQYDHARQTGANESGPTHFFELCEIIKISLVFTLGLKSVSNGRHVGHMQMLLWLQWEWYF